MLGFTIISKKELNRLQDIDSTFTNSLNAKNARVSELELKEKFYVSQQKELYAEIDKLRRERNNKGQFVKKSN